MTRLPAAAEPRHTRGGAGGAARADEAAPAWHRQKVKLPKRVWGSGHYTPGAVAVHAQVTALAQRSHGCTAGVTVLAGFMGISKRTAERCLAELAAPGPDGRPELVTRRRTGPDGDGETALRRTRPVERGDHWAYVPVLAAKTLRHPAFVIYCALTYAVATGTPVTAAELGELLGVTERSARRLVAELEALGWVTVHRRAGGHGRHAYEVHDHPLRLVADEAARPDTHGGSGADTDGGSLVIKEDAELTDESTTQVGGAFRRRRGDRKWGPAVDTAGSSPVGGAEPGTPDTFRPAAKAAYDGPQLTLSPRVWAVLAPVQDLLPAVSPYLVRRIAREIGRQLDGGVFAEDIRDQLQRLRAWTPAEDLRDPGRWILGAALPVRPGKCGRPDCHYGFTRYTGAPCKACAEVDANRHRGDHPPPTSVRAYACTACSWTSPTPLPLQRCAACRTA
ncbi:MarR family transcriptional regulator [Streptomyces cellulosae]